MDDRRWNRFRVQRPFSARITGSFNQTSSDPGGRSIHRRPSAEAKLDSGSWLRNDPDSYLQGSSSDSRG